MTLIDDFVGQVMAKMPAPGGRYLCPLIDCAWSVDVPNPTVKVEDMSPGGIRVSTGGVDLKDLETAVAAHFAQHHTRDFLVTIQELARQVEVLKRGLANVYGGADL